MFLYFNFPSIYKPLNIKIDMQFSMDFFNKLLIWLFSQKRNVSFLAKREKKIAT